MLFFLNLDGTVTRSDTDHVYQGQNKVANVELFTLISPAQAAIQVAFTLPNGLTTTYSPMSYVGAYSVDESNQKQVHHWKLAVPYNVTEVEGQVGVSFNVLLNDGTSGATLETINQTTYTASFLVEYSALPVPPTTATESELEQILTLLNLYYTQNASLAAKQPFVVGTVTTNTLDADQQASVAVEQSAVADGNGNYPTNFAFSIPKGKTGATGATGDKGETGLPALMYSKGVQSGSYQSFYTDLDGYNRTPQINDSCVYVSTDNDYLILGTIQQVLSDTQKAHVKKVFAIDIEGRQGPRGDKGDKGDKGNDGTDGTNGLDGDSSYGVNAIGSTASATLQNGKVNTLTCSDASLALTLPAAPESGKMRDLVVYITGREAGSTTISVSGYTTLVTDDAQCLTDGIAKSAKVMLIFSEVSSGVFAVARKDLASL